MSLNKYDATTGTLTTLANGQRIWLGTKAAHDAAAAAGTLPTNCLIAITDDGDITGIVDAVEDGNMNPVTSNAVYDAKQAVQDDIDIHFPISPKYGSDGGTWIMTINNSDYQQKIKWDWSFSEHWIWIFTRYPVSSGDSATVMATMARGSSALYNIVTGQPLGWSVTSTTTGGEKNFGQVTISKANYNGFIIMSPKPLLNFRIEA